jgi:hypothetical protein
MGARCFTDPIIGRNFPDTLIADFAAADAFWRSSPFWDSQE